MFCTKCGKQLAEGAKFCSSCGNSVVTPSENLSERLPSAEEKKELNEIVEQKNVTPVQSNSIEDAIEDAPVEKGPIRTVRKVGAIIVSVFTLIAVLYMLTSSAARLLYSLGDFTLIFWLPALGAIAYVCMVFFRVKLSIIAICVAAVLSMLGPGLDPSVLLLIGCLTGAVLEIIAFVKDRKENV